MCKEGGCGGVEAGKDPAGILKQTANNGTSGKGVYVLPKHFFSLYNKLPEKKKLAF